MIRIEVVNIDYDRAIESLLKLPNNIDVQVGLVDGDIQMKSRVLIFHLLYWEIASKWGLAITQRYIVDLSCVTYDSFSKFGTLILDDICTTHPSNYRSCIHDFARVMNRINNIAIQHCQQYHRSLNIVDLMVLDKKKSISDITSDKISDPNISIMDAEKKFKANVSKLFNILKKPSPDNAIWPFVNLAFVGEDILAHIFYQIGFRTDIDDTIIRYPIQGNYLNGLQNYVEYVLEALSAKKSTFYNKESIPFADYFGRRQHLLLSCIPHLYRGDCGSDIMLSVDITKRNSKSLLYKYIVDGNNLVCLSGANIGEYIGKQVKMRSPLGCRYTNGVCEICAGKLIGSIADNMHIGIYAALQTTEKIVQVILSSKHLQRMNSIQYTLPPELIDGFIKVKGGIFVKPNNVDKMKKSQLVFYTKDAMRLINIAELDVSNMAAIDEQAFGNAAKMMIIRGNNSLSDMIFMEVGDQSPRYSKEFIKYIADNQDCTSVNGNLYHVDMSKFDFDQPLFKITSVNLAMVNFVRAAKKLLETQIRTYTSGSALYNDFTELVRTQVNVNTVYLELVLRASMMESDFDVRLPVVTDLDNICFGTNNKLNFERSLGTLAAFEQLPKVADNPLFFLKPKIYTAFDSFLNLKSRN